MTWKPCHFAQSQVTTIADLDISWVTLTSLFAFCFSLNSYMWRYTVCFTIYVQRQSTVSSLVNYVFDATCSGYKTSAWVVSGAFSDVTIVLTRVVTIVLTLMHGDVNNASLGEQQSAFQNKPSDLGPCDLWSHLRNQKQKTPQVTWDRRRGQVTCQVTWVMIRDRKRALVLQMCTSVDIYARDILVRILDWTCYLRTPSCHV